jgi:uncharacterized protein (TIGR02246 family)
MSSGTDVRGVPVSDRLEVLDLYARQSQLVDASDGGGWADTFTPDGEFVSVSYDMTARGRDALAAFAVESNRSAAERGDRLRHHVTDVVLERIADDELAAVAYLVITAASEAGTRIDRSVVVTDRLVRHDGAWRVARRATQRD